AVAALHTDGLSPQAIGLEFRRQFVESLRELARLSSPGGRLAHLEAFAAVTIFHGLRRLGFGRTSGPTFPWIVGPYQRPLPPRLPPIGRLRTSAGGPQAAQRLMISRQELIARYGDPELDIRAVTADSRALSGSLRRASGRP